MRDSMVFYMGNFDSVFSFDGLTLIDLQSLVVVDSYSYINTPP